MSAVPSGGGMPPRPEPTYGRQIQTDAATGLPAEAQVTLAYDPIEIALADGTRVALRAPRYALDGLAHGPLADGATLSPRIAPPVIGLGLLEAIPADAILARADPDDADGDGISGRAQLLPAEDGATLGRFGWKAGHASVAAQAARAFADDLGLSTAQFPAPWGDCTPVQAACRTAPHGDGDPGRYEVGAAALEAVVYYLDRLAAPTRGPLDDPQLQRGEAVFHDAGCAACHTPAHEMASQPAVPGQPARIIRPYTDLLLHDMGPGLADGFAEGRATGSEWRTAPLWGLGLTREPPGATHYLHDGRARTLLEAILWHGGEAEPARDAVTALTPADRDALIEFLGAL